MVCAIPCQSVDQPLRWHHNGRDSLSNHQPHHCLLNRLFRRRSKKTSKLRVTGLCLGNSPGTSEFPAQMASNAENVSIWWRHHDIMFMCFSASLWACHVTVPLFLCRPVGMPYMEKVTVHNPDTQNSLHLLSISGSTLHFHCSFFQDKVSATVMHHIFKHSMKSHSFF